MMRDVAIFVIGIAFALALYTSTDSFTSWLP